MEKRFTIGLVIANISDQFSRNIAKGAMNAAQELDVNLAIIPMKYIGREVAPESADEKYDYMFNTLLTHVSHQSLDYIIISIGEIVYSMTEQDMIGFMKSIGDTPVMSIAAEVKGFESLVFDNTTGVKDAVKYLIKSGRKRIGLMKGEPYNYDCIERNRAYREALEENGIEYDEKLTIYNDMSSFCHEQVEKLLKDNPDMDALICCNDTTAETVYKVFAKHNISVGDQIAVVGFDDLPMTLQLSPTLSSVRADAGKLAYSAVVRAVEFLNGNTGFVVHERFPTQFILRESCFRKAEYPDHSWIFELDPQSCTMEIMRLSYNKAFSGEKFERAVKACERFLEEINEVFVKGKAENSQKDIGNFVILIDKLFKGKEGFNDFNINKLLSLLDMDMKYLAKRFPDRFNDIITVFTHLYQVIAYSVELRRLYSKSRILDINHRSNIITRDVLMFATEDPNKACDSMLRQLHLLNIKTSYIYLLKKPIVCNCREDVPKDLTWDLEAYNVAQNVFVVPPEKREITSHDIFRHEFIPKDRRWTMLMTVLYSNNVQYGFALFELGYQYFNYLEYLTYQFSAAVKIRDLIKTQNETLVQLNSINVALHNMSTLDQLTGTLNRRGFYNNAAKQFEEVKDRLVVMFADLDGLKMINDNFGHSEGDVAIKAVADCLREVIGDIGIVGRVGGDEFVAMMPSVFDNMTDYVRNRCNDVMEQLNDRLKKPYKIAVSMGIFECRASDYQSISEIIDKADYLLYVQKREKKKLIDD